MATQEKIAAVSELKELFEASNAVILTEYRGLSVAQLKELRRALGAETEYAVVKNTLTEIAAREAGLQTVLLDRLDDYPMPRTGEAANGHTRAENFGQITL